jgi:DinB family protein
MIRKKKSPGAGEIGVLLHAIDEAYGGSAWHGPTLKGSLRGVTARQAAWRPAPGRHSIRELAAHAAYWKFAVRRRLTGDNSGSFPLAGSNWLALPPAGEKAWRAEREILDREHRALRAIVAAFVPGRLRSPLPGMRDRTALREIAGIALHDVYHTGQIQLVKALQKKSRAR